MSFTESLPWGEGREGEGVAISHALRFSIKVEYEAELLYNVSVDQRIDNFLG